MPQIHIEAESINGRWVGKIVSPRRGRDIGPPSAPLRTDDDFLDWLRVTLADFRGLAAVPAPPAPEPIAMPTAPPRQPRHAPRPADPPPPVAAAEPAAMARFVRNPIGRKEASRMRAAADEAADLASGDPNAARERRGIMQKRRA